jgi:hypothetical protein
MVAAVVAVPAALAGANPQAPGAYCKAHPELIGTGHTYATFVDCVKKQTAQSDQNTTNAAKACKAEQADTNFATNQGGGKTFDQYYGTNGDNGNGKASAKTAEQQNAQTNAAKKCRTPELKALIGVGAGKQYKNFGACVAAQTKTHS